MKPTISYFADTDTLAIEIADRVAVEAEEVAENVIVDFDDGGRVVGLTIEHASYILGRPLGLPVHAANKQG